VTHLCHRCPPTCTTKLNPKLNPKLNLSIHQPVADTDACASQGTPWSKAALKGGRGWREREREREEGEEGKDGEREGGGGGWCVVVCGRERGFSDECAVEFERIHTYTHTYVLHTCILYIYTYAYIYTFIHLHTHTHTYTHTHTHVMCVCIYTCAGCGRECATCGLGGMERESEIKKTEKK